MTSATLNPGRKPTSIAIRNLLRSKLGRQWRVGDRLPPMKELARQLGQGQTNTHQAVRDLAAEGLLDSRQRRGTYVLRTPASDLSGPRHGRSGELAGATISLFHADVPEGFIRRMVDAFNDAIGPTGATLRTRLIPTTTSHLDFRAESDDDAIVIFNPGRKNLVHRKPNQLLCVVSTSTQVQIDHNDRYDVVSVDERHGGSLAGQMLRAIGCEQACFLGCGLPPSIERCDETSALRLYGFENAWGSHLRAEHILLRHGYSPQAGGEGFGRYMRLKGKRPDGVFAASDDLAVGFLAAAASHDMRPGRDFQIIGFDGQDRGQSLSGGGLTTVKVPAIEMGRRAAQLLIERFNDPDRPANRLQLECALHRGSTTATPQETAP